MVSSLLASYIVYIAVSLVMVIWVGRTLFTNGAVFLQDVFQGSPDLAMAVNRLLLVGFYLVNIGFVLLTSSLGVGTDDPADSYQALTVKLGGVALLLGVVHVANLSALNRARQRRLMESRRLPMSPPPLNPYAARSQAASAPAAPGAAAPGSRG
jgi:hypothetical protein